MAMTPLAFFDEDLENPSILASHDGEDWVVPNGLKNPIDRATGNFYHSDPDLVLHDGVLYCFYRLTSRSGATVPRYRTSTDGVHWSPLTVMDAPDSWTSLAVVHHGGLWHGFYIQSGGSKRVIRYRTATDPAGPWSAPVDGPLVGMPLNRDIWHIDVVRHGGRWLLAGSDSYAGQTGSDGQLVFASSTDGSSWRVGPHIVGKGPAGAWDSSMLYRPSFYVAGDTVHLYYGGVEPTTPSSSWWIGKTEVPLKTFPG